MKAVIYARYSSDKQTEQSIEGQVRECMEYANHNDLEIVKIYADRGISGKTDERVEFQQMIEDSSSGLFSAVIVYKLDRFARNRYDSAVYKAKLKKNGVRVLSAKEAISDRPEGILMESLLEGMAEYYSLELAQKTFRGMRESALKCRHTGGRPLLGYKVNPDKSYAIDEESAPIVRTIFDMYLHGSSYNKIIDTLNRQGARTGAGRSFGKNSIHEILRNERYAGTYIFNRIPRNGGKRNNHGSKDPDDIIRVEGGMPAIIDRETWEGVKAKMEKNKKSPAHNKARVDYLLAGKLYCGKCGGAMVGQSTKNGTYQYYVCNTKVRKRTCAKQNVKKDIIEQIVIEETVNLLTDEIIAYIADQIEAVYVAEANDVNRVNNLRIQLKSAESVIHNIGSAIAQGIITPTTRDMLVEAEQRRDRLKIEIAQEEVIRKHTITSEQAAHWISQFQSGDPGDADYRRKLIDVFVNKVFLYDDKIVITYNFSGDKNTITLNDIRSAVSDLSQDGSPAPI